MKISLVNKFGSEEMESKSCEMESRSQSLSQFTLPILHNINKTKFLGKVLTKTK